MPAALGVETLATAVLSLAIFGLTDENNTGVSPHAVPALIGACIVVLICTFGPLTQAGMNPARDFSPRIVALIAGWPVDVCFQAGWCPSLSPTCYSTPRASLRGRDDLDIPQCPSARRTCTMSGDLQVGVRCRPDVRGTARSGAAENRVNDSPPESTGVWVRRDRGL